MVEETKVYLDVTQKKVFDGKADLNIFRKAKGG